MVLCGSEIGRSRNDMHVGEGCHISDKWIPNNLTTELYDINNKEIKTSNRVKNTRMYIRQYYYWFM